MWDVNSFKSSFDARLNQMVQDSYEAIHPMVTVQLGNCEMWFLRSGERRGLWLK